MENYLSQTGMAQKQLAERYAEYTGPAHDQSIYYPYEPTQPSQGHGALFKQHFGGSGHKNNSAMSALTLLAFLFFLHILQQCLKDHMTAMSTPQVMIMTGGRDGEENIAKHTHNKIDKTGETEVYQNKRNIINAAERNDGSEKHLMKITTSEQDSREKFQTNKNYFNRYDYQYSNTD